MVGDDSDRRGRLRGAFSRTVTPAYVALRRAVTDTLFERRFGVSTSRVVLLGELGLEGTDRVDYVPSGWWTLRRVLRRHEVSPSDVFVDFGCGMGRMLLLAAQYPFRRVVGVELSPELAEVSRRNAAQALPRLRCRHVETITSDVLTYEIPDDITVAFFYNPFHGRIFETVVERLVASYDRNPRRVRIVYRDPAEEDALMRTGRVRIVRTSRGLRPTKDWSRAHTVRLYEVTPTSGPAPATAAG